jgi:glycosyltransferase involved in cell wall biosynthesis
VYVDHIADVSDDGVVRLPDPDPDLPTRPAQSRWWPPVMLSPEWVRAHDFDVFHVQFGFDAWDPGDLAAVVDAVHEKGRRFVQTVHDLRNPHHDSRELHDAQLEVLVRRADEVVTLTPGAAREIEHRWDRAVTVLPHPHVVDFATMRRSAEVGRRHDSFRVGLHVKSLRASMVPHLVLPVLVDTVREIPGGMLQVNGHKDVLLPDGARYDEALATYLTGAADRGLLDLHVHDFMSDAELFAYLAHLDVSVLPYRFGTHSGWLEACRDLGTAVVAPTCGYYADQGPVHSYVLDEDAWDPASLRQVLLEAWESGPVDPLPVEARRRQRARIAAEHRALYGVPT